MFNLKLNHDKFKIKDQDYFWQLLRRNENYRKEIDRLFYSPRDSDIDDLSSDMRRIDQERNERIFNKRPKLAPHIEKKINFLLSEDGRRRLNYYNQDQQLVQFRRIYGHILDYPIPYEIEKLSDFTNNLFNCFNPIYKNNYNTANLASIGFNGEIFIPLLINTTFPKETILKEFKKQLDVYLKAYDKAKPIEWQKILDVKPDGFVTMLKAHDLYCYKEKTLDEIGSILKLQNETELKKNIIKLKVIIRLFD